MLTVAVGDVIEGEVCDFASEGEGIVKIGSYAVFVPFAIKGEIIRARIRYAKKDYAFADLIEVEKPSPYRIKPKCTYFGTCGGCDLQHVSRECQLAIKKANVENALKKTGGLDVEVDDVVRLNDWEYRNKIALPFGYKRKTGRVTLGFYEKRTHSVVPMKWCALHGEWAAKLIAIVTDWANANRISVYDEGSGKGILRHVVARNLDTLSVTLVVNSSFVPKLDELCQNLGKEFAGVCVYVSENTKNTNAIFGKDVELVYGKEKKQNLGPFDAIVSPLSFLQVNNDVRDAIYDEACKTLKDFDGDILEFYSGVGLLTAQIAMRLKEANITSVEIEPSAVENAIALMKSLGIDGRVKCVCDDVANYVKALSKHSDEEEESLPDEITSSPFYLGEKTQKTARRPLALVLDPPRKGCDKSVLESAIEAKIEKIVYVSCNPQTLARDLKILSQNYVVNRVVPYDMFPQTSNVEVFCELTIRN